MHLLKCCYTELQRFSCFLADSRTQMEPDHLDLIYRLGEEQVSLNSTEACLESAAESGDCFGTLFLVYLLIGGKCWAAALHHNKTTLI